MGDVISEPSRNRVKDNSQKLPNLESGNEDNIFYSFYAPIENHYSQTYKVLVISITHTLKSGNNSFLIFITGTLYSVRFLYNRLALFIHPDSFKYSSVLANFEYKGNLGILKMEKNLNLI